MKQHLNTLFVTTEGAYLKKDGQAVVVRIEQQNRLRLPLHNLDGIVCFGRVGCSPALMQACAKAGVSISFMTQYGGLMATVSGFTSGNVLLRRQQYRAADSDSDSLNVARQFVSAKLTNSRSVLLRAARDSHDSAEIESLRKTATIIGNQITTAHQSQTLDQLRGIEGDAANRYFQCFNWMIAPSARAEFQFTLRSRRPPLDPINCLLSFLYTMLTHDARSACESAGLDAAVGFLHRDRPGRPGLALDLIEEFRPFIVDRLVLSLINRKQIQPKDFQVTESGAVLLEDSARKSILAAFQKRKQDTITHPFLGEKTSIGLLLHLQARLLARHLRGDIDAYPPFIWK